MIKPNRLKKGDKIAIVSLSSGMLGEEFTKHNLEIGLKRLREFGLEPQVMPNTLQGIDYLNQHPEKRAEDLISAFKDKSIKGIMCAIGGDDTYRTLPYLMENQEFLTSVKENPKIFTGFSDTTVNHFMFHSIGMTSYYGMAFITDLGEISDEMLPYTEEYFRYYLNDSYEYKSIHPSDIWYEERTDFSANSIGKNRKSDADYKGFELLQGKSIFEGVLLGGCIESIYDMLVGDTHENEPNIIIKYSIFPKLEEWQGKILFLETSELKIKPEMFKKMMLKLKEIGVFKVVNGVIFGKPQDGMFYQEYKKIITEVMSDSTVSVVCNVNFGHATPRCILPIGIKARVDVTNQKIDFLENPFER